MLNADLLKAKYKAVQNAVYDSTGRQICVILPSNCTKKKAADIAKNVAKHLQGEKQ